MYRFFVLLNLRLADLKFILKSRVGQSLTYSTPPSYTLGCWDMVLDYLWGEITVFSGVNNHHCVLTLTTLINLSKSVSSTHRVGERGTGEIQRGREKGTWKVYEMLSEEMKQRPFYKYAGKFYVGNDLKHKHRHFTQYWTYACS